MAPSISLKMEQEIHIKELTSGALILYDRGYGAMERMGPLFVKSAW